VPVMTLSILLCLLIPIYLLLRHVHRNLRWEEPTVLEPRRPSRYARLLRAQRRREVLLTALWLDPDEEGFPRKKTPHTRSPSRYPHNIPSFGSHRACTPR
jgi:hypothetical protein